MTVIKGAPIEAASCSVSRLDYLLEDQRRTAKAKNYFAWQRHLVRPEIGQRVIEVGCGTGNFTGMLLDRQAVVALDAEPLCIKRLLECYPQPHNVQAYPFDATSPRFHGLARFRPDSCVCLNVLEHIEHDAQAMRAMASVLVPGGRLFCCCPRFRLHFINFIGFFGWWANARVFRLQVHPEWQIAFFDRLIATVLSRAEAVVHPPFGQSLFAVFEKPWG